MMEESGDALQGHHQETFVKDDAGRHRFPDSRIRQSVQPEAGRALIFFQVGYCPYEHQFWLVRWCALHVALCPLIQVAVSALIGAVSALCRCPVICPPTQ